MLIEVKQIESTVNQSQFHFEQIFENAPIGMAIADMDEKVIDVNKSLCDSLGFSKDELLQIKFDNITHPDDVRTMRELNDKLIEGSLKSYKINKRYFRKDSKIMYAVLQVSLLHDEFGKPFRFIGQIIDVTEENQARIKLEETEFRLKSILKHLPNIVFYETRPEGIFLSDTFEEMFGYSQEEFYSKNDFFDKVIVHKADLVKLREHDHKMANAMRNNINFTKTEFRAVRKDGSVIWLEDHIFAELLNANEYYLHGFMINITEQKIAEEKVKETQNRLSIVVSNLPNVVFYETGGEKEFITDNIELMLGYSPSDIIDNPKSFLSIIHPDDINSCIEKRNNWKQLGSEDMLSNQFRAKCKNGKWIWIEDHIFEIKPAAGKNYVTGVMIDVTDIKSAEDKILKSLKEKEVLIKEIHHRVKNNLQIVSSLLKLQSRYVKDKAALEMLNESQSRVQSMALVHQRLYQSKNFTDVNFQEYLQELLSHLFHVYKSTSSDIQLKINAHLLKIGIDFAIPCGLIINELVSNALKYAFPANSSGIIEITMNCNNQRFTLIVKDNGTGFPEGVDFRNTVSMGLQLVMTLTNQLDGKIEMLRNRGTEFRISFSEVRYKERL